ncbi:MAG: hypothetical protein WCK91_01780 [bacterium]
MQKVTLIIGSILLACSGLSAQNTPKGEVHAWIDTFGGSQGAVLYPQYGWSLQTGAGKFSGFGFVEVAPHEPLFTNHLVVFTPGKQAVFAVQTETGGLPDKSLGFHQIGPRINLNQVTPKLKGFDHLFIAALPRFIGIRPNNLLVSGGTNQFTVAKDLKMSIEGYRRFFPGGRPDYSEYWLLAHPKKTKPFSFGVLVIQSGPDRSIGFGTRLALF